jgi:hypothetical protein
MAKPAVILIGADKGGVGKTTVARTLLDYFGARHTPARAFDTESPRGTLKRFHPDVTEVVDVTAVSDQMKIFDTVGSAEANVTVIDVRAGLLSSTLQALSDIGFIELGKTGKITLAMFHILGPSIASLEEIAARWMRFRSKSAPRKDDVTGGDGTASSWSNCLALGAQGETRIRYGEWNDYLVFVAYDNNFPRSYVIWADIQQYLINKL